MNIQDAIYQRRAIYPALFTGDVIQDDVIQELLNRANQAPSHKHTEPWRFRIVKGEAMNRLADFFQTTYKTHTSEDAFSPLKFRKLRSKIENSSHILIISMQLSESSGLPEWEELAATACAVQNLWLSCDALQVGGYWSTPNLMIQHIDEFAAMNDQEKCLGFFYLGVPKRELVPSITKKPIEHKISWIEQ